MSADCTARELMVIAAARQIADGDVAFIGMRLPLLGFCVAKATHAPNAIGLFENGVVRDEPAVDFVVTMGDTPNLRGAAAWTSTSDVLSMLQRGRVDVGFIGGAEIDRFGNLNTTQVGPARLPGSGGAADIAAHAKRTVYVMEHQRRRIVERVGYVTSPGYGDGPGWRRRHGLRGGPSRLITTLAVFAFDEEGISVESLHAGVEWDEIVAASGLGLRRPGPLRETAAPSAGELAAVRRFDPQGFWTR